MSNVELSSGQLPINESGFTASQSALRARALGAIGLVLLAFALFWPTTVSLSVRWQDSVHRTYTHGYLVVALAVWLLWRGRARWSQVCARVSPIGLVALVGCSLGWLVAYRAGLQIVHQALLPLIIATAILSCFGLAVTRRMALPLAYVFFAIPVWDAVNPLLQWSSVFAVRTLLRLAGIPAFFADNTFQIPAGSFEIADGCSGLHFFVVALAISVLYGEINRDSLRTRIALVVLASVLAMLTNWVRIFIIVVAGHLTDMQHYLVSEEHYSFGWFLFAGMMLLFFLVVRRWPVVSTDEGVATRSASDPAIPLIGAACAIAGLLLAPVWNLIDSRQSADVAALGEYPQTVPGWEGRAFADASWQPVFNGADRESRAEFHASGVRVESYAAIYALQEQGKEIVYYLNSLLGRSLRAEPATLPAMAVPWTQMEVSDAGGERWLLWYSYQVGESRETRGLQMQIDYGLRSLFDDPLSAIVALRSRCSTDCTAAQAALAQFAAALPPLAPAGTSF